MSYFLFKRFLILLLTLLVTSMIVFLVLEVLPGNAAQVLMGPDADPAAVQAKTIELGLDKPALQRYGQWLSGLAQGKLGVSYAYGSNITSLIGERLQVTIPLAIMAMLLTTLLAIMIGIYAASHHDKWEDTGLMALTQLGMAVPGFWLAMMLILVFSVKLQWFSAGGFDGWYFGHGVWSGLLEGGKSLLLPAISLAVVQTAILARFVRSAILENMRQDYVRTARAKGLSRSASLWRHVLRNAMIPVITIMGLQFASLLAGTIVIETVFYLPGLGRLIFQGIANRDMPVVRNCVMFLAAMVVLVNFVVDVLYAVIDPRARTARI